MSFYRDEQFDKLSERWANVIIACERGAAKTKDVSAAFNAMTDYLDARFQAATEAAKATGTAGELPPEWISEVCGADVDGLSYGQGYRRGFNDCRKKVSELQAKLITDEEAWEIIKDEARMQVIDEHGSMAIVIKSPSEAWFIARAILAANNRPSMITAEDCPICKGQSGGIGADGVENDCHECFRREVQAARQPAPVVGQIEILLRELIGIGNSNRRGVGARVTDMLALIHAFQSKHFAATNRSQP